MVRDGQSVCLVGARTGDSRLIRRPGKGPTPYLNTNNKNLDTGPRDRTLFPARPNPLFRSNRLGEPVTQGRSTQ